jgi:hypothetical protein
LIYDSAKHRSNLTEVEKALNFFVQQRFTTLHDCISTRTLRDILEPTIAPGIYNFDLGLEVAIYTEKYKQYLIRTERREEELSQLYGVVEELYLSHRKRKSLHMQISTSPVTVEMVLRYGT